MLSQPVRRCLWLGFVGVVGLLTGCASTPQRPTGQVDALYRQLDRTAYQFNQALGVARQSGGSRSAEEMNAALEIMRNEWATCSHLKGCDVSRFRVAYEDAERATGGMKSQARGGDASSYGRQGVASRAERNTMLPEARRTNALLGNNELSSLAAHNSAVQAAIKVWLTRARPQLIRSYVDYQYLRAQMWPAFRDAGLPDAVLFGLMAQESGGRVHAVSRAGAAGPLQFMPETGARFGLMTVNNFDERFDPVLEARAAAAYLNEELGVLNANLALVLAAYNGGEGLVGRLAAQNSGAGFWNPDLYSALSEQTRAYVPSVLAAAWLFLHPERYNLHFPTIDGVPGNIELARPASLDEISVCLGDAGAARYGWYRTLRNLNPRLDPSQVIASGTSITMPKFLRATYERDCTSGRWVALASELQTARPLRPVLQLAAADPPAVRPRFRSYTVRPSNTLYSIARRFDCESPNELAKVNRIRSPADLVVGKRLTLVGCDSR